MHTRSLLMCSLAATGLALLLPSLASACGGTFCDGGGPPMPVEQTGEDVLFVQEGDQLETHVLIRYEGEAENFSWVVPVMTIPEIDVGSEPLFGRLSQATAPRSQVTNSCFVDEPEAFVALFDSGSPSEPEVVDTFSAGAFEGVVLDGGTVQGVMTWLEDNGYATDAAAEPILAEYLENDFLFVAFKLKGGEGVDEIHPIVIRQDTDEPCVPIRLTSIAAEDDMGVRVYFLDDTRWVPTNYKHVELNRLRIAWPEDRGNYAGRYNELLTLAVDEAGGRAFATQFAGVHSVSQNGVVDPAWDGEAYVGLEPKQALELMVEHNLMFCTEWNGCVGLHALSSGVLREFLPAPQGTTEATYWEAVLGGQDPQDLDTWSGQQLGDRLEERIFEPGRHASDLLDSYPYLTRLGTTISAHEMTKDPIFGRNYDLDDVDPAWTGTVHGTDDDPSCDEFSVYEFEAATFCTDGEWPELGPYASRVEQFLDGGGPPMVSYDATQDIEEAVATHNASACMGIDMPDPPDGEEDTGGDDGGMGGDSGAGDESGGPTSSGESAGCACDAPGGPGQKGLGWGLFALFGIAAIRRKK